MGNEITHDHLDAAVERLETSFRREVDQFRTDVKDDFRGVNERVSEVNQTVKAQNGRIGKSEADIRTLRHDLNNHVNVEQGRRTTEAPSKGFVAGVIAAILVLAGLAHAVWDLAGPLLKTLFESHGSKS